MRDLTPCGLNASPKLSEFVRRVIRLFLTVVCCDLLPDAPAGINGIAGLRSNDLDSGPAWSAGAFDRSVEADTWRVLPRLNGEV